MAAVAALVRITDRKIGNYCGDHEPEQAFNEEEKECREADTLGPLCCGRRLPREFLHTARIVAERAYFKVLAARPLFLILGSIYFVDFRVNSWSRIFSTL